MKSSKHLLASATVAVVLLALLGACSSTRSTDAQLDDAGITSKVKTKLAADPEVNPFDIDVDTLNGVVTLRGEVARETAKTEAYELAASTRGVLSVRNEIQVVPPPAKDDEPVSDAWITTKVKSKLTADPQVNAFNIDVDTQGGVVTLSGIVKTETARAEAEKLARDTRGVLDVVNEIQVEGS